MNKFAFLAALSFAGISGCGGYAKRVDTSNQSINRQVVNTLQSEVREQCNTHLRSHFQRVPVRDKNIQMSSIRSQNYNPISKTIEQAGVSLSTDSSNSCVVNIIRAVEFESMKLEDQQMEFTLGPNTPLNIDLIKLYSNFEQINLSHKISCLPVEFPGYFMEGFVCTHDNLTEPEKTRVSRAFHNLDHAVSIIDSQIISQKK